MLSVQFLNGRWDTPAELVGAQAVSRTEIGRLRCHDSGANVDMSGAKITVECCFNGGFMPRGLQSKYQLADATVPQYDPLHV